MSKVAWIGLGVMGYPMAGHLKTRGHHDVVVFNRTSAKAEAWVAEFGGKLAPTPAAAAQDADFIFTCVGNDNDLRAVTLGPDGAFSTLKPGAVAIDNTTASAEIARELHAAAKSKGAGFLDAPVSGGQSGAENGTLTVMVGGDQEDFRKAQPVIKAYARRHLIGPSGSATHQDGQPDLHRWIDSRSAEALHFAKRAGLIQKVIDTIPRRGAVLADGESLEDMVEGRLTSASPSIWCEGFRARLRQARKNGAELPVTALVDQFYAEVQAMGGNRWDTSSLIALLERKN
jgi:3-hydroxyisobutyrate dehydrogenase-like beta-hydroxyacid dehydrogenase